MSSRTVHKPELHLSVSVRSPRARAIAEWAHNLVEGKLQSAADIVTDFPEFPILLTRSLDEARSYLRDRTIRPGEIVDRRMGLLASSQARRLRAFGIEMDTNFQSGIDWPQWFIEDHDDLRSSYQLEVAASEFKCQGLEIDWACLCWGDDFLWEPSRSVWRARKLIGSRWQKDNNMTQAQNRYRVLLTRARYGLVIWVPKPKGHELLINGDDLDATAEALLRAGVQDLR